MAWWGAAWDTPRGAAWDTAWCGVGIHGHASPSSPVLPDELDPHSWPTASSKAAISWTPAATTPSISGKGAIFWTMREKGLDSGENICRTRSNAMSSRTATSRASTAVAETRARRMLEAVRIGEGAGGGGAATRLLLATGKWMRREKEKGKEQREEAVTGEIRGRKCQHKVDRRRTWRML